MEDLNQNSTVNGDYNEIELELADSKIALPAKSHRHAKLVSQIPSHD